MDEAGWRRASRDRGGICGIVDELRLTTSRRWCQLSNAPAIRSVPSARTVFLGMSRLQFVQQYDDTGKRQYFCLRSHN